MEGVAGKLRVVCAWCRKVLQAGDPGQPVSHGICAECRKTFVPGAVVAAAAKAAHRHHCWHPDHMVLGALVQKCCGCPETRYAAGHTEDLLAGGHR